MPQLFYPPHAYIPSGAGFPQAGATLDFYVTATSTRKNTYSDFALTTPNANPVVADANGVWGPIYLASDINYRVTAKTALGALIYTQDDVPGVGYLTGDIRNFGAQVGVDCSAIVTTAAAAVSNVIFPAGAWVISSTPTIPSAVTLTALPGATFSGSGASALGLAVSSTAPNQISEYTPPGSGELATYNIFRNPTSAGGAGVSAGLRVQTNVGSAVTQKEWAIIGIVNNSATAGENVGIYGQGNKGTLGVAAGPTWGMVAEAHDKSGLADPTSGLVGLEVHISSDGTDANTRRIGIDVVGDIGVTIGGDISYGIRIGAFNGVDADCLYYNGIYIRNKHTRAINISSTGTLGIDISGATLTAAAIRMKTDQLLSFTSTDTKTLRYNATATGLVYANTSVDKFYLLDNGSIRCALDAGIPAGGSTAMGVTFSSTANYGVFAGSGAPTLSAAKGSLYLRSDGSGTTDRAYINTNGTTTWTAITTVA